MGTRKGGRAAPAGRKLGPPYGTIHTETVGKVTVVVRKIFARHDYFHWRIINTDKRSLLELTERKRGGVLKHGDADSLNEALSEVTRWIAANPMKAGT